MNWKMLDFALRRLNVSALKEWKTTVLTMDIWIQAIVVGVLVLLIGSAILSWGWGFRMNRPAQFAAGASAVFHIALIACVEEFSQKTLTALIIAAVAGAAAGFLYAFFERIFQFAAGLVLGSVLSGWMLKSVWHMDPVSGKGRIWHLLIAIAAGVLFALCAKKLKLVLTALEGGVVLGLICDVFLPVTKIPWVKEKLSGAQIQNLLPLLIAAVGFLIQFIQYLRVRAEQKALQIPAGGDNDSFGARPKETEEKPGDSAEASPGQQDEAVSIAQAEEVLVEKAKELAMAASRSAQQARFRERCIDVAEGLYGADAAAKRLGMSEKEFLEGMKKAGYELPGASDTGSAGEEGTPDKSAGEEGTPDKSVSEEVTSDKKSSGKEETSDKISSGEEGTPDKSAGEEGTSDKSAGKEGTSDKSGEHEEKAGTAAEGRNAGKTRKSPRGK